MPIDARIALGVQGPQFESPINAMQNAMQIGAYQNKLASAQQEQQRQRSLQNFLSSADLSDPATRAKLNQYDTSGETFRNLESGYSSRATGAKAEFESALAMYNDFRRGLGGLAASNADRDTVVATINDYESRGILKPELAAHYRDTLPTDPAQLQTRLKRGAMELASPDQIMAMFTPKIDFQTTDKGLEGIDVSPDSPTFGQTRIRRGSKPPSPGTVINMGDRSFGKGLGEGASKDFTQRYDDANSALDSYRTTNTLYPLVNNPDFISGAMGDWRAEAAKQLGLPGAAETDVYFSQVGKVTGQEVKAFGAAAGISEGDRKYAAEIAGGSRAMSPEAIRSIMYMRQMINRYKIRKYNERRAFLDSKNPDANISGLYEEIPVPPPPAFNAKGWELHYDKKNNAYAYVGPADKNGKQPIQEVQ
jgi:hypothetical protein